MVAVEEDVALVAREMVSVHKDYDAELHLDNPVAGRDDSVLRLPQE